MKAILQAWPRPAAKPPWRVVPGHRRSGSGCATGRVSHASWSPTPGEVDFRIGTVGSETGAHLRAAKMRVPAGADDAGLWPVTYSDPTTASCLDPRFSQPPASSLRGITLIPGALMQWYVNGDCFPRTDRAPTTPTRYPASVPTIVRLSVVPPACEEPASKRATTHPRGSAFTVRGHHGSSREHSLVLLGEPRDGASLSQL